MTNKKKVSQSSDDDIVELSKADLFYIKTKCLEMSIDDISKDLGLLNEFIEDYYNKCVAEKTAESLRADKLMNVSTKKGFAVMSQAASEKIDGRRKVASLGNAQHIHKIRQSQ